MLFISAPSCQIRESGEAQAGAGAEGQAQAKAQGQAVVHRTKSVSS